MPSFFAFLSRPPLLLGLALMACEQAGRSPVTAPAAAPGPAASHTRQPRPGSAAPDTTRLLAPGRAGRARIGMRVGELRLHFGPLLRAVTMRRGDEDFPAFAVGRVGRTSVPALLLEPLCEEGQDNADGSPSDHCRIWRITVRDPAYRTAAGLGVGSRYGEVRLAAPVSFVGPTTMGIAATAEEWHMDFLLDPDPIEVSRLPLRRETVHDSVRVIGVQLYR